MPHFIRNKTISGIKRFHHFIFAIFCCSLLPAQAPDVFGLHLNIDNGLSNNYILSILQDRTGFIWLGTVDGLNRYDGKSFTCFRPDPHDANSISDSVVTVLLQDRRGRIWAGTQFAGLNRLDPATGRWTRYRHDILREDSLGSDHVLALHEDREGNIWIGAWGGGLQRYDPERDCFIHFRKAMGKGRGPGSDDVNSIVEDGNGNLWIGTWDGLNFFDRSTGRWTLHRHDPKNPNSLSSNAVTTLLEGRQGELWIGTWNGGLNRFDTRQNRWRHFLPARDNVNCIRGDIVFSLAQDDRGLLWVGGNFRGVSRYDPVLDRWLYIPDNIQTPAPDHIDRIVFDRSGTMWLGSSENGVYRYPSTWSRWNVYFNYRKEEIEGKNQSRPTQALEDRQGNLWIGTPRSGLLQFDRRRDRWTRHLYDPARPEGIYAVLAVLEDSDGMIWAGIQGGIACFDARKNHWLHYSYGGAEPKVWTNALLQDHTGSIWVGAHGKGLFRFDSRRRSWVCYTKAAGGLCDNFINCLYEDRSRLLWIGTNAGISRLDPRSGQWLTIRHDPHNPNSLSHDPVNDIIQTGPDTFWIGTDYGLNRYHPALGHWECWLKEQGLPHNSVKCITHDLQGFIWGGTGNGMFRLNPATGEIKTFLKPDGLSGRDYSDAFRNRQGRLFFCCEPGCVAFDPRLITDNKRIPAVVLTSAMVPGKSSDKNLFPGSRINLTYSQNAFSFEFAALDFTWPEKNQYAFKLEGFDREWIQSGTSNHASYTNIPPGKYVFRAIGSNSDGVWNREGAALEIIIQPPFWMTWWFRGLALAGFAYLSYLAIFLIRRYILFLAFWKKRHFIGQYKLIQLLGSGGMATVYLAHHLFHKDRRVAVKLIHEEYALDPVRQRRFRQEGAIIDQLDHAHIVKVHERGMQDGKLYIVMEYLQGITLAEKLKKEGPVPLDEWLEIMEQLADVLVKIHGHGIIHRDLKPGNVMLLKKRGQNNFVKVLDFGLARQQFQTTVTEWGGLLGTMQYIAPEMITHSQYTGAGDIYALGLLGYEMLAGRHPLAEKSSPQMIQSILSEMPADLAALRPGIPIEVSRLVMRMIAKDPARRPEAEALLGELKNLKKQIEI